MILGTRDKNLYSKIVAQFGEFIHTRKTRRMFKLRRIDFNGNVVIGKQEN